MQVLGLNLDWSGFLAHAESLVWLGAALAVAVAAALVLCAAAMVFYALREAGGLLPGSDFMGFGQPLRRDEPRSPARVTVPARRSVAFARITALAGIHLSR